MGDSYIPLLRDTKDIHYRYKMPKLTAKVEGSGNGIKTVITNMSAVAKALHRPPTYPTKFFGCELGAQVSMDAERNEFIVNGAHDVDKLITLLYSFIRKFVFCPKCNNPETDLKVIDKKLHQSCIACGHRTVIPTTMHKLATYIINHPPNDDSSSKKGGKGKDAKKEKKSKKNGGSNSPTSDDKKIEDDFKVENNGDDFDEFEDDDLTNDAYRERMQKLMDDFQAVQVADPVERANMFYKTVTDKKDANLLGDVNVQKELLNEAERLGLKEKATLLLSEALFTENIIEEVKTYRLLLLRFCVENHKAQKYLLGGLEKLIGDVYKDKLLNKTATIFKTFYDNDILEEETLIEWADKVSKKYVSKDMAKTIREKAAPLIKWLKEAEVEDDSEEEESGSKKNEKKSEPRSTITTANNKHVDEDEDDDDLDIEYSHRVTGIKVETVTKPTEEQNGGSGGAGDDDLNIDDI